MWARVGPLEPAVSLVVEEEVDAGWAASPLSLVPVMQAMPEKPKAVQGASPFLNRELSWLQFNRRAWILTVFRSTRTLLSWNAASGAVNPSSSDCDAPALGRRAEHAEVIRE